MKKNNDIQVNPKEKKLMLGNEAIARGAYEAGVKVTSAYPGTPSTEISECIARYDEVYAEWAPNEKVAAEVTLGASMAGARSMTMMKMVGLNVASDPLFSAAYIGVGGGMVLVVADDPGIYSSQNEQDTRMVARAAMVPVVEPSDSEEARVYTKLCFNLSEEYDTPIILRSTTRLSHSQSLVCPGERIDVPDKPYERNIAKNVMMPAFAIARHRFVEDRLRRMAEDANTSDLNRAEYRDTSIGVITSGIPYQYVREALPDASVLKLGLVFPLPEKLIKEFASKVDRLIIVEELEPVIEEQVRAFGVTCEGKDIFTRQGEYSANMLRSALYGKTSQSDAPAMTPPRPPILCPGCPHRSVYHVLNKMKIHAAGDIGCYTLGAMAPLSVVDTTVCMGSGISTLHGMEKAAGREFTKNWVAVIGDSTFLHTGLNSLMNMVYNSAAGTVIILDNSTTGMTGHQDHAATGKTLKGDPAPAVDLHRLCEALGVNHIYEANACDIAKVERSIREALKTDAPAVILAKSQCALLKSFIPKGKCRVEKNACKKCGMCLSPACPAMSKDADGCAHINPDQCNGCRLCEQICKFEAIKFTATVHS